MRTLEVRIDHNIIEAFPEITVGGFLVEGIKAAAKEIPDTTQQFQAACQALTSRGIDLQNLVNDPRISGWRSAFQGMGLKPSTFKSSPEQLARRLLKGEVISTPFPVVNIYCAISAKHLAAMGGYDLNRLSEPTITVRFVQPGVDCFTPLAGRAADMPLSERIVVYASGREVICYAFNHRDAKNSCLIQETDVAVFFSEAVNPAQYLSLSLALEELRAILVKAGARCGQIHIINKDEPGADLTIDDSGA
jgi:DNA/RNA-binding domain of Phe-tRNA-synthetase-like protein